MEKNRAGYFVSQPSGYKSFVPCDLPPDPSVKMDKDMISMLSSADRSLGRLDGVTQILPNPDLFVAMYVRKEAVLSSQIEGTQASLSDILVVDETSGKNEDVREVVNYVNAMNYGLKRIEELPLSLRLLREIHAELLKSGRGSKRNPGEFRNSQNWIGPEGSTILDATFVPPTVPDMKVALGRLESFFYNEDAIPPLIKIALIHAQFESIHPFLDGNGRVGRLLITFWLCQQKILSKPLLYLSYYFKRNRVEYYDRLMDVRLKGDWEGWIRFFLKGVQEISIEAAETAKDILALKGLCEEKLVNYSNTNNMKLLNFLFGTPILSKKAVEKELAVTFPSASKIVDEFCKIGILQDINPEKHRYKHYAFTDYISLLNRGTELS